MKTKIGKIAITPKGEYSSAATYNRLDAVSYKGNSYIVLKPCSGVTPCKCEFYALLAEGGKDGKDGERGEQGKSAYELWLEQGNEGTEADFIASLSYQADLAENDPTSAAYVKNRTHYKEKISEYELILDTTLIRDGTEKKRTEKISGDTKLIADRKYKIMINSEVFYERAKVYENIVFLGNHACIVRGENNGGVYNSQRYCIEYTENNGCILYFDFHYIDTQSQSVHITVEMCEEEEVHTLGNEYYSPDWCLSPTIDDDDIEQVIIESDAVNPNNTDQYAHEPYSNLEDGKPYLIIFDGKKYVEVARFVDSFMYLGCYSLALVSVTGSKFNKTIPFCVQASSSGSTIRMCIDHDLVKENRHYTYSIYKLKESAINKIPTKYLPNASIWFVGNGINKTIDPIIGGTVSIPDCKHRNADMSQNNTSSLAYVKNRTHWVDDDGTVHKLSNTFLDVFSQSQKKESEILPETTLQLEDSGDSTTLAQIPYIPFVIGNTYIVYWNGEVYNCVADGYGSYAYLGRRSDASIPFAIASAVTDEQAITAVEDYTSATSVTLSIKELQPVFDNKYMPLGYGELTDKMVLLPETDLWFDDNFQAWGANGIAELMRAGNEYTVTINGVEYTGVAMAHNLMGFDCTGFGNQVVVGGENTGEPFFAATGVMNGNSLFAIFDLTGATAVRSSLVKNGEIKRFDPRLITASEVVLTSPSGKQFRLTVDDSGNLTATDVAE